MPKKTPASLTDAIEESPERFLAYLNIDKIVKSKNPYQTFLKQFQKAFGQQAGLNLWQYVIHKYKLLNELYKNEEIQEGLPDEFKGPLNKKETKEFFEDYVEKTEKQQEKREIKVKKLIKVKPHIRKGKEIKGYNKTKPHEYTDRQQRFILARKEYPVSQLSDEFNRAFGTSVTKYGIRDKKARLLGKK